jgi:GWxTD domain-containing protein
MSKFFNKIIIIVVIVLFTGVYTLAQSFSNLPNIAFIYSPKSTTIHPQFTVFNLSDEYSDLFIKLNLKELNFIQLANRKFQAKVKLKFIFYKSLLSSEMIDSSSKIFTINQNNIGNYLTTRYKIKTPKDNSFLVIITEDMYNEQKNINFIKIDKTKDSPQNFLLVDSASNLPIFNRYVSPTKTYYLKTNFNADSFATKQLYTDTTMPAPPASKLAYSKNLKLKKYFYVKKNSYFKLKNKGIYVFYSPDTASFTYRDVFGKYFPYVLTPEKMIPPLEYISSTSEFNKLKSKINQKLAVDDYWLKICKNPKTARTLIKIFYNRVQMANYFFSSYKPGWMTDRGMIFIVLGPPIILHKADNAEEWIYYNSYNGQQIDFFFKKQKANSLFSDYLLQRSSDFYKIWSDAVKSWQSGIVFTF